MTFGELCHPVGKPWHLFIQFYRTGPCPDRHSEARIVPPRRMKARPRSHDLLALLGGRRQRPGRRNEMQYCQIFEQEMPLLARFIILGFVTTRDEMVFSGSRFLVV